MAVRFLDLAALEREAEAFDRAAAATTDIDRFCSSSAWIVPAAARLMAPGQPVVASDGEAYAAFVVRQHDDRRVLEPFELAWGLACPLVGPAPEGLAELAARVIERVDVDLAVIAGIAPRGPLLDALVRRLAGHRLGLGPPTRRHLASLAGGRAGFLARRSRELRKSLRKSLRRAEAAGVVFEHHVPTSAAAADALFERAQAVEARSWKGAEATGLADPGMAGFYRDLLAGLAPRGAVRVTLARLGERDVGVVLGARLGELYRGLQFSYDDAHAELGLGNLGQYHVVGELEREGVTTYDLGTGGEYKARWAERVFDTVALIVGRRRG